MIVEHFLRWNVTARVCERAAAATALARAYLGSELDFENRCAAEAALTLLLDDSSEKVRFALAEALSMSQRAPAQIVCALACDQPEIAALVLVRSPLLADADLIDRIAAGDERLQPFIARRASVSMALSAAIAEVGAAEACLELLRNTGASVASLSFRRIAERFGDRAEIREAMLGDKRLSAETRHMLLVKLGEALRSAPLVLALIGAKRAERVTREACVTASLTLIERTSGDEHAALVEHLRLRGDLTTGFIIRAVAHGKVDFFGAVLVALTGQAESRIRALLANGRDVAVSALFRAAGLAASTHAMLFRALVIWRQVANGERVAGPQEVTFAMLRDLDSNADAEIAALLKSIHLDALRDNARGHALAIAAA